MQQVCLALSIHQSLIPLYNPEANPVERRNGDLNPQLAMLMGIDHTTWDLNLSYIRFAMNSATCQSTGFSPGYLKFERNLRTPDESVHDLRTILGEENGIHGLPRRLDDTRMSFAKLGTKWNVNRDEKSARLKRSAALLGPTKWGI